MSVGERLLSSVAQVCRPSGAALVDPAHQQSTTNPASQLLRDLDAIFAAQGSCSPEVLRCLTSSSNHHHHASTTPLLAARSNCGAVTSRSDSPPLHHGMSAPHHHVHHLHHHAAHHPHGPTSSMALSGIARRSSPQSSAPCAAHSQTTITANVPRSCDEESESPALSGGIRQNSSEIPVEPPSDESDALRTNGDHKQSSDLWEGVAADTHAAPASPSLAGMGATSSVDCQVVHRAVATNNYTDTSLFPPASDDGVHSAPFTHGEPLSWQVPPGVAAVQATDLGLQTVLTASDGQFTSVVSNASVVRGAWMYEVTLCSDGLLQIGWCGPLMMFPWTPRLGVGDFPFTIAYDGHRQQLWNVRATSCGHRWAQGDVVTVCFDLECGVCSFYLNGDLICKKRMLTAMAAASCQADMQSFLLSHTNTATSLQLQSRGCQSGGTPPPSELLLTYSPAISLGQFESCVVNLGAAPFRFPVHGFQALDVHGAKLWSLWEPRVALLTDQRLRGSQNAILMALIRQATVHSPVAVANVDGGAPSGASAWGCVAYCLYQAMRQLALTSASDAVAQVMQRCMLLLRPDDAKFVVQVIASHAALDASTRRLPPNSDAWGPSPELFVLRTCVARCPDFRRHWTSSPLFQTDFINVFRIKAPNHRDMAHSLFPAKSLRRREEERRVPTTRDTFAVPPLPSPVSLRNDGDVEVFMDATPEYAECSFNDTQPRTSAPFPQGRVDALDDHEQRSALLYDCVVSVDDTRRLGILTELLDASSGCTSSATKYQRADATTSRDLTPSQLTVKAIGSVVHELRQLLVQKNNNAGGTLGLLPRLSDVCVDSAVALRLFFALTSYVSAKSDVVRRSVSQSSAADQCVLLKALQDAFFPVSMMLQPTIENMECARFGGPYAHVRRAFPLPSSIVEPQSPPCAADMSVESLLIKTVILYSASVKELVIASCGDCLLRHRQKMAWHYFFPQESMEVNGHSNIDTAHGGVSQHSPVSAGSIAGVLSTSTRSVTHSASADRVPKSLTPEARQRLLLDLVQTGHQSAWAMATLLHTHRCGETLAAFCSLVVCILESYDVSSGNTTAAPANASQDLFAYVPIVLVECFVDVWHLLRKTAPNYAHLLRKYPSNLVFFLKRVLDPRIAHVETGEYLLLSLNGILDTIEVHRQAVVEVLAANEPHLLAALQRLLLQFHHPLGWALTLGVWTKMNVSNSFCLVDLEDDSTEWNMAFPTRRRMLPFVGSSRDRAASAQDDENRRIMRRPPQAFMFFRTFMLSKFLADAATARSFFKSLVNHSNWSISELNAALSSVLGQCKQDNSANRNSAAPPDLKALLRRVAVLFEVTRKILSVLEFTVDAAKTVFFVVGGPGCANDQERHQNVTLLLEIWTQTLTRFCTASNVLTEVMSLGIPDLAKLEQWKLMAPVMGVLFGMLDGGANVNPTGNIFLSVLEERQFTWSIEAIEAMMSPDVVNWAALNSYVPWDKTTALLCPDVGVLAALRALHQRSARRHAALALADDDDGSAEEGMCTICCCRPADTIFQPCLHTSCVDCINRQMMSSGRCFYCNANVTGFRPRPLPAATTSPKVRPP